MQATLDKYFSLVVWGLLLRRKRPTMWVTLKGASTWEGNLPKLYIPHWNQYKKVPSQKWFADSTSIRYRSCRYFVDVDNKSSSLLNRQLKLSFRHRIYTNLSIWGTYRRLFDILYRRICRYRIDIASTNLSISNRYSIDEFVDIESISHRRIIFGWNTFTPSWTPLRPIRRQDDVNTSSMRRQLDINLRAIWDPFRHQDVKVTSLSSLAWALQ